MAISISTGQYHPTPRPPLMRRRGPEHDGLLAVFMVAVIMAGIIAGMLTAPGGEVSLPRQLLQLVVSPQAPVTRPVDGVAPAPAPAPAPTAIEPANADVAAPSAETAAPEPAAVAPQTALPAPLVLAVGKQAQVVNTEGQGVVLHAAPRTGARQPFGLLEGVQVTVLELRGGEWARVESSARKAGWVPVAYLAPVN